MRRFIPVLAVLTALFSLLLLAQSAHATFPGHNGLIAFYSDTD